ncbi:unnamed protein product [Prorocentrum cordatum]|uniref:Uncharacterized protein n=1 Tax=Prorocentrum cordatum TaxID=2364126 RepID=A0ABN9TKM0_9DINO|nr:unnamed protein product [Polarella glacialis]
MAVSQEEASQLREEHARMAKALQEERDRRASEQEKLKARTRDTFQQLKDRCNAQVTEMQGKLSQAEAEAESVRGRLAELQDKLAAAEKDKADSIQEVVGKARDRCQELAKENGRLQAEHLGAQKVRMEKMLDEVSRQFLRDQCLITSGRKRLTGRASPVRNFMNRKANAWHHEGRGQLAGAAWQAAPDDGLGDHPLGPVAAAVYLREILTCEESLRAAFEPVRRAAWRPCPEGLRVVDRGAFAQAVVRISAYFNPLEPITLRMASEGRPYSVEEATGHFRMALCLLADRLEDVCQEQEKALEPRPLPPRLASAATAADAPQEEVRVLQRGALSPRLVRPEEIRQAPPLSRDGARLESTPPLSPRCLFADEQEREQVAEALAASRARAGDLRRALAREEALLLHQAGETRRLELLKEELEVQDRRRRPRPTRRRTPPPRVLASLGTRAARPGRGAPAGGAAAGRQTPRSQARACSPGSGPMSLDDLKQHLAVADRLKRRAADLESELDGREEQVAELSAELEAKHSRLSIATFGDVSFSEVPLAV